ncbi:MAG: hypothetical protein ACJ796_17200 [Gemmatimonadaceae bacterium]
MRFLQNAVFAALKRVQLFLDEYAAVLAALVDLTAARKKLDAVVASFTDHAYNQDANDRGVKGETAKQHQLRVKLRGERMDPIALIARKNLRTTPEFAALQMPKPTVRGEAFIASANAMADAAAIHKETFIAHGMPPAFLDDLKTAITTLDSSMSDREQNYNRRLSATEGLDAQEKQGRLVLSVLDKLLQPALLDNDSLKRGWEGARQIRRRPGPGAATPTAPTTPGTVASVGAPASTIASTTAAASSTPTAPAVPTTPTTPPVAAA